jgi:hypothetical protein
MDFETLAVALPRYAGMSPYDQIPFQWSVHIQRKPGSELEHYEFVAEEADDPRPEFAKTLCQVVGKKGSILAYSSGFESGRLADLAESRLAGRRPPLFALTACPKDSMAGL